MHIRSALMRLAAVAAMPALAVLAFAGTASAATGSTYHSGEQVGYAITGGQFNRASLTVTLPVSHNYAAEVTSFGASVQLWTATRELTFGISNTTGATDTNWSPGLAVFDRAGTAPSDVVASGNSGFGSYSIPQGHQARLTFSYDRATGFVHATLNDLTAGTGATSAYNLGRGASITQVRVGYEVGCYAPWDLRVVSGCGSNVTQPAAAVNLPRLGFLSFTSYSGSTAGLNNWWTKHAINMTSNGTGSGTVLAKPGTGSTGFTPAFQP